MQVGSRLSVTPVCPCWPTWPASLSSVTSARGNDPLASANLNTWSVLLKNVCALARQVASPLVTLVDDGTYAREWGTYAIDDEGIDYMCYTVDQFFNGAR